MCISHLAIVSYQYVFVIPPKVPCSICHCVWFSTATHSDQNHPNFLYRKLQNPQAAALCINTLEPGSWSTPA